MTISKADCAKLLRQADNQRAVSEVVSAYLFCKYVSGKSSAQVLCKLQLLAVYLKQHDMRHVVEQYGHIFTHNAYHIQVLNGGAIGATPTLTSVGKDAWNECRRTAYKVLGGRDKWGQTGPAPVRNLLTTTPLRSAPLDEVGADVLSLNPYQLERVGTSSLPNYRTGTLPLYRGEASVGSSMQVGMAIALDDGDHEAQADSD